MNRLYRNLILERVRFALASARAAAALEHAGVKGAIREALIADLFRPLLPADFGLATGILISSHDQQSAQQDIVVFDKRILPPLLFEGPTLIPVEAALATIEVKSRLSATELRKAQENAFTVGNLPMLSGVRDERGNYFDPRVLDSAGKLLVDAPIPQSAPTPLLFALESDLNSTGKSEIQRYMEVCGDNPYILGGMCIVDKGGFGPTQRVVFDRPSGKYFTVNSEPLRNEWSEIVSADGNYKEVLTLIANIHSLVLRVATTRGQPPLSGYLLGH